MWSPGRDVSRHIVTSQFLSASSLSPAPANHFGANTFKDVFVSRSVALELNLNFNKSRAQQPIQLNGEQEHAVNGEVWQRCERTGWRETETGNCRCDINLSFRNCATCIIWKNWMNGGCRGDEVGGLRTSKELSQWPDDKVFAHIRWPLHTSPETSPPPVVITRALTRNTTNVRATRQLWKFMYF